MNNTMKPKATDSLETWLSYLEKSHFKPIDMGLERVKTVASGLDLLTPTSYVITVAGTNGKGSTCRLLEQILLNSGLKVGVYSSPHLIHYNERVRLNGMPVDDSALIASFNYIEQHKSQSLTYFEFGTLAALDIFRQAQVDVAILEVGLGGRLDATNIVDPNLAVITSIDIDHVEFLGDNREAIGREKAGVFRKNIPVVIGEPDCPISVLEYAKQLNCHISQRDQDWQFQISGDQFIWQGKQYKRQLPLPQIPQPNCATALAVVDLLPFEISEQAVENAVKNTKMVGRFQTLDPQDFAKFSQKRPLAKVIVDVGHNPHAARYLATRLQALKTPETQVYAVFSALVDKDLNGIVQPLTGIIDHWYCAGLAGYRGQSGTDVANKLQRQLPHADCHIFAQVNQAALAAFEHANAQDIILIFGSFFTVADFMQWLAQ